MTADWTGVLPVQRLEHLVITEVDDGLLIYDPTNNSLHQLNDVAATVWRSLDGKRSGSDLLGVVRGELGREVSTDAVRLTLSMLSDAGLLASTMEPGLLLDSRTRRTFLGNLGIASIPAVVSVSVPLATAAASVTCNNAPDCVANDSCIGRTHYSNNPAEHGEYAPGVPIENGQTGDFCCESPSVGYCPPCIFEREDFGSDPSGWIDGNRYEWRYDCQ